jgi:murein DD-endopeptidase MepM/ murein hydrolase activator NlpD
LGKGLPVNKQATALRGNGTPRLARTLLPAVALCALSVSLAQADFFRYTGEDGVETFTNTPTSGSAVRILREGRPKPPAKMPAKAAAKPPVKLASNLAAKPEHVEALKLEQQFPALAPLLPVRGIVTSGYGWRHDPIDGGIRHHNGVDIAIPTGTKVKAIAAGRVIQSGSRGGYGNLVTVEHGDGSISLYGHNSQLEVRAGDQVETGQTVALSGSTGRSTGPHLHFELWKNGSNVTEAYLNNGAGIPEVAGGIRSYLHKDGSIVFTNLN